MLRCKLCEWRHFWCTPLFLTRFFSLWNKGVYQKCLSSSYSAPLPPARPTQACTHTQTYPPPNFISIHQASQRCDKLHLNVESVEGLFLSAGSCQKPRHVTVPNARESQNHNLKTIYRWNVVILRWLGGENDCRSLQSSKLENHASSGTNKIFFLKGAVEMKPDFSPESQSPFFVALGNSGTLSLSFFLLFLPVFPLPLHSLLLSLIWSPSVTKTPHRRFDHLYCSKAQDICPNSEEASFFFFFSFFFIYFSEMPSHASCHLSEKQTCLCCKCWKRRKMFPCRKIEMWEEGLWKRRDEECLSVSVRRSSGSSGDAPVLNLNVTEGRGEVRNLNQYFTSSSSAFFFPLPVSVSLAYVPQQRCCFWKWLLLPPKRIA